MKTVKMILAALLVTVVVPAVAQTSAPALPTAVQTAGSGPAPVETTPTAATPVTAAPPASLATTTATPGAVSAGETGTPKAPAPSGPPLIAPDERIGVPGTSMGLQPQVTAIGQEAAWMHNVVLMPIITAISLFVLGLLLYAIMRFRRAANPTPSRTSHNTVLEVVWTLVPVLVLLVIAVPSIRLLAHQYSPPKADLTVKVIGNQWYWTYQYPDNGDFEVVSNMLKEQGDVKPGTRYRQTVDGPRLLAVDERMVVPAGAVVKIITTSNDVIHSFAVPAFWTKMDAVPGRLNETWFKVDRPGVYFGQCSELCGARHAFMPIAVEVVPPAQFAQWVASKGGTMPGRGGAKNPDATSASSPATAAAAAPSPPEAIGIGGTPSDTTVNATAPATIAPQGATANN